jgi:endonuclease/exonuclease/phosphatase family metal-dependent hydrolase
LFQQRYLEVAQANGGAALHYPHRYLAPVNTGVPSGLDLDGNGETDGIGRDRGNDAWGYGLHPGQYGMLVLSRFPISDYENRDISVAGSENRGMLHCQIALPEPHGTLHVICVHLGLKEAHRHAQMKKICDMVNSLPPDAPVVVAGDFNDWQGRANTILKQGAGLKEVFSMKTGRPARTFPARFPVLRLDRIYVRNATISHPWALPRKPWSHLSDHAPLAVEIHL